MSIVSKEDVQSFVKDALGEELADLREEIVKMSQEAQEKGETDRKYTHAFIGEVARPEVEEAMKKNPAKGVRAARFIRLLAAGRGDPQRASDIAKSWGDTIMQKSLNESVFQAGGALVPEDFMNEVIELLRAKTVVREMGTPSIPMNMGSITMPFQDTAATAQYIGELQNIPPSQPSFGQLTLSAKKLVSLVPISNDLLRDASINVDAMVRDDMVRSMSLREDIAFIRDNGGSNTPKGMRFWALPANVFQRTSAGGPGAATLDEITNDLFTAMLNLENLNIPMNNAGWLMTPRTKAGLMRQRDLNGNFVFRDEMLRGTLMGYKYATTTQIPTNLNVSGAGNDTEVYFADFSSLVIAESTSLEVSVYEGGAFNDGTGIVSGISSDQTVIRTLARHDFGARQRGQEISVITGVDWGV